MDNVEWVFVYLASMVKASYEVLSVRAQVFNVQVCNDMVSVNYVCQPPVIDRAVGRQLMFSVIC